MFSSVLFIFNAWCHRSTFDLSASSADVDDIIMAAALCFSGMFRLKYTPHAQSKDSGDWLTARVPAVDPQRPKLQRPELLSRVTDAIHLQESLQAASEPNRLVFLFLCVSSRRSVTSLLIVVLFDLKISFCLCHTQVSSVPPNRDHFRRGVGKLVRRFRKISPAESHESLYDP